MIKLKRVYEPAAPDDGYRVLVDRLWPRGLSKEKAAVDLWMRDVAPTTELRKWYGHEVEKWPEFRKRYKKELAEREDLLGELRELERREGTVTLLFGAKDEEHNQADVLAEVLGVRTATSAAR
ncbi:MAG: DUF488 domain-containing protein [Coriobacteriia bacterium]